MKVMKTKVFRFPDLGLITLLEVAVNYNLHNLIKICSTSQPPMKISWSTSAVGTLSEVTICISRSPADGFYTSTLQEQLCRIGSTTNDYFFMKKEYIYIYTLFCNYWVIDLLNVTLNVKVNKIKPPRSSVVPSIIIVFRLDFKRRVTAETLHRRGGTGAISP